MEYETIGKPPAETMAVKPNLPDLDAAKQGFQWADMYREISWLPGGYLNQAHECIDRHVEAGDGDKTAMIWVGKNGEEERYTFADMKRETARFANVLEGLGVQHGERVFIFMERLPELYFAFFGVLKHGAVVGPLFSAFGPDPVRDRMEDSGARVLITQPDLRKRIAEVLPDLPALEYTIIVNKNGRSTETLEAGDLSYEALMADASDDYDIAATSMYDYSVIHYTSGTTGKPKGAAHRHLAVVQQYATGKWVLDFHPEDLYWCTADPGWVTGTSYGMFAPWSNGVTQLIYEGGFGASAWYQLIEKYGVTVWYTAPTAVRMLMKAGEELPGRFDLSTLRHINSVGEPLNPEAVVWGTKVFDQPIHDNWWQTETGAIMVANYPAMDVRPGSMGRPIPGIEVAILDNDYNPLPPGNEGYLAVRPGWPSMFHTYWNNQPMYNTKFHKGWYISGDQSRMDEDGYVWFVGRADDVINTAGHLVGPFEVESVLIEHPAVAEAAAIGVPDDLAMEVVKGFVALKDGFEPSEDLRREILGHGRQRLQAIAPRSIEFRASLPKTRSGKIMRRLLKAEELGLPLGDISTLEDD